MLKKLPRDTMKSDFAYGLLAMAIMSAPAYAAVRLPAIISDHMVLQRASNVPVWGWANPGESVSVTIANKTLATHADAAGRWRIDLDLSNAPRAPATLIVSGDSDTITVSDVLVGEVWLASGQSNMARSLEQTTDASRAIAAADHADIRLFKVERRKFTRPQYDVKGQWSVCTPVSIRDTKFSAVAYYFGRKIEEAMETPVGLIDSTWGGTQIQPWIPAQQADDSVGTESKTYAPATIYNGMVAGLAPYKMRGVIWYQGESNIVAGQEGPEYTAMMEALVASWRSTWQAPFPFYFAQVAPHLYHVVRAKSVRDPQAAPRMWEAQAQALRIPGTGMVVTTDLVDNPRDIHPRDKRSVGLRLANLALHYTYRKAGIVPYGPVFRTMSVEGDKAVLSFDFADGLASRDGKPLSWFEVAGSDGNFHAASAVIERGRVVVGSADVDHPTTVRFAWDESAQANLVNRAGLPALPFRSDHPFPEFGNPKR